RPASPISSAISFSAHCLTLQRCVRSGCSRTRSCRHFAEQAATRRPSRRRKFANRLQALELQRLRRAEALLLVRARVERGECPRAQALHSGAVMGSVAIAFIQRTRIGARVREQVPTARLVVMHANHLMAE